MKNIVTIEGMKCDNCAITVGNRFEGIAGVSNVEVDRQAGQATVESTQELTLDQLNDSLQETKFKAIAIEN